MVEGLLSTGPTLSSIVHVFQPYYEGKKTTGILDPTEPSPPQKIVHPGIADFLYGLIVLTTPSKGGP